MAKTEKLSKKERKQQKKALDQLESRLGTIAQRFGSPREMLDKILQIQNSGGVDLDVIGISITRDVAMMLFHKEVSEHDPSLGGEMLSDDRMAEIAKKAWEAGAAVVTEVRNHCKVEVSGVRLTGDGIKNIDPSSIGEVLRRAFAGQSDVQIENIPDCGDDNCPIHGSQGIMSQQQFDDPDKATKQMEQED